MTHSGTTCDPCSMFKGRAGIGLLAVLLLASATRLIGLSHLDVWGDEVYSHHASSDLLPKLLRWETIGNESSSPWPFIEMKVARQIFGEGSSLTLRVPSAVHGILAVGFLYILIALVAGWQIALWAAIVMALNPHGLEWSREGRMYTQWLSATIVLIANMHYAVEDVRQGGGWYSWRWWLAGCLFMVVHAMNVMGTMTIAGIALWLGIVALTEMRESRTTSFRIILGAALAGTVYLGSWGLTGIAKILMLMSVAKSAGGFERAPTGGQIANFLTALPGHLPLGLALVIWLLAATGLVILARSGHWRFALLVAITAFSPWLGYYSITKTHFWTPRYAFTGILFLSVGLGVFFAELWRGRIIRHTLVGPAVAIALLIGTTALAAPYLREIFLVPKMEVRKALAPIQQHGKEGEVIMLFPDYYVSFDSYKPYQFARKARIIRGPEGTGLDTSPTAFTDTFENLYTPPVTTDGATEAATETNGKPMPKAAWLFLLRPDGKSPRADRWNKRIAEVEPVLKAYGLTGADVAPLIGEDTYTITLRISRDESGRGRIEHVVTTLGRRFR